MKLLLVLPQPPAAEGGAADRCSLGLLRGLSAHGIDVTTLAARQPFTPTFGRDGQPEVEVVELEHPGGWAARLDNLRRPHSELARSAFASRLHEVASGADVVHLEQIEAAVLGPNLPQPTAAHLHYRVLLDRDFGPPWRREFRQVLEFVRAERHAARHHRWLIANSPRVADTLRGLAPKSDVVVAPLTLDPDRYRPGPPPEVPTAGLVGTAAWPPTKRAFAALADDLWPRVRAEVPDARLVLAGRGTEALRLPDGSGGAVLGEVDSAVDVLRSFSVLVYPLSRGSGMKVKVLEAMALGVPVVTTPEGAEGIGPSDGVFVADEDDDLVAATVALLRDATERAERGRAARATFDERLSPAPAVEPLVELYRRMAGSLTS